MIVPIGLLCLDFQGSDIGPSWSSCFSLLLREGGWGGGYGGEDKSENVKLQTLAITEFMYTTYSFCYNLMSKRIISNYLLKYKSYKSNFELSSERILTKNPNSVCFSLLLRGVKLQTLAITESMYTTYSFCYNLHFRAQGSLVNTF